MCAGAMTAVAATAGQIAFGAIDIAVAGGAEHMGRHPMGEGVDPNPRIAAAQLVDPSATAMRNYAENLHDTFPQLTKDEIVAIVDLEIAKLDVRLRDKDMGMELTTAAKALLAKKGYDPVLGARPLRRTIQREIEDVLSEKILYGQLKPGEFVLVGTSGEGAEEIFTFEGSARSMTLPEIPDTPPVDAVADQVTTLAAA